MTSWTQWRERLPVLIIWCGGIGALLGGIGYGALHDTITIPGRGPEPLLWPQPAHAIWTAMEWGGLGAGALAVAAAAVLIVRWRRWSRS